MNYNAYAIAQRKADVVFLQEHKLNGDSTTKIKQQLKDAGWELECGPCDETTKKPNAGVGVASTIASKIDIIKAQMNTEGVKDAY